MHLNCTRLMALGTRKSSLERATESSSFVLRGGVGIPEPSTTRDSRHAGDVMAMDGE